MHKLGRVETWITDVGAGSFLAVVLGMLVTLPLTFALEPAPRPDVARR
jgi:hypothetical protein